MIDVNKKWDLITAFNQINEAHRPGGHTSGPIRNAALRQWITVIGPKKSKETL